MLDKLKSMIQYDLKNIEIENHKNKNDQLQKELLEQQKQTSENDYKGRNKIKILLLNRFKYKDSKEDFNVIFTLLFIFLFILLIIFKIDVEEENYIQTIIAFSIGEVFLFSTISLFLYYSNDKTKPYECIEEKEIQIEENKKSLNEHISSIEDLFETSKSQYENYTDITISKNVFEESMTALNEDTIKSALRLSGGGNIKYGHLIKLIIDQEENEKFTELYNKLKHS